MCCLTQMRVPSEITPTYRKFILKYVLHTDICMRKRISCKPAPAHAFLRCDWTEVLISRLPLAVAAP